jgi:hypothetical protein
MNKDFGMCWKLKKAEHEKIFFAIHQYIMKANREPLRPINFLAG